MTGRVEGPALRRYSFWIGEGDAPAAFRGPVAGPFEVPANGRLGIVDLSDLPAGPYTLKLIAEDACGDDRRNGKGAGSILRLPLSVRKTPSASPRTSSSMR